jgi:GMP synthase (glutamine-hydrolysing)
MTRKATVFQHVAFEDLGSFEEVLKQRGYELTRLQLGVDELGRVRAAPPDLLVVLGGPISVNDGQRFPFLSEERAIVRERLLQDAPCLGICLGAQLMSIALGGSVSAMASKEIGWSPIELHESVAADDPLRALGNGLPVLHWHGEQFSVPEGATLLASTPLCAHQAFAWRRNGLALQFHPEVTARALERWYIGHVEELSAARCDIPTLRQQSEVHAERLRERARSFFEQWLSRCGL